MLAPHHSQNVGSLSTGQVRVAEVRRQPRQAGLDIDPFAVPVQEPAGGECVPDILQACPTYLTLKHR